MSYKPQKGSNYWMINSRFEVKHTTNTGSKKALDRIKVGNCFKTKKQAQIFRALVMDQAQFVTKRWWEFWK